MDILRNDDDRFVSFELSWSEIVILVGLVKLWYLL